MKVFLTMVDQLTKEDVLQQVTHARYVAREGSNEHGLLLSFQNEDIARQISKSGILLDILAESGLGIKPNSGSPAPHRSLIFEVDSVPTNIDFKESIQYVCEDLLDRKKKCNSEMYKRPQPQVHEVSSGARVSSASQELGL